MISMMINESHVSGEPLFAAQERVGGPYDELYDMVPSWERSHIPSQR